MKAPSIWATSLPDNIGQDFNRLAGRTRLVENVTDTIAQQMGGMPRIRAMLGAKIFELKDGLAIAWPSKQRSKGNRVEIVLNASDTYDVKFFNVSGANKKLVASYDGIYADRLVDTFEKQTGYYLRL